MRCFIAGFALLAFSSSAFAESLIGKTIVSNPTIQLCNNGQCRAVPGSLNMYISEKGQLFDYGSGNQGAVIPNGGSLNGVRFSARGGTLVMESPGIVRLVAVSRGSSCTVSAQVLKPGWTASVERGYSCSVVQGRRDR